LENERRNDPLLETALLMEAILIIRALLLLLLLLPRQRILRRYQVPCHLSLLDVLATARYLFDRQNLQAIPNAA
jgi:hypothetical protein